jgi:hypothetical protein
MTATTLANQTIVVIDAITNVNSKSFGSRILDSEFKLGSVVFERNDGVFFENISFEDCIWSVFFRFESNTIELTNTNNKKASTITIKKFQIN